MQNPDEPTDKQAEGDRTGIPAPPPLHGATETSGSTPALLSVMQFLKRWVTSLAIPTEVTLGALVLAAFLIFPAYKGLRSGSAIRQLEGTNQELQQKLSSAASRTILLERTLSERDIQLTQRQQLGRVDTGSGLYISPLLFLESKESSTPDLISIDFAQADQAILVFSIPRTELREVEISVYQETRLAWTQTIGIPEQKLFNENLVSLLLTRSALGAGTYRMIVEGNARGQRVKLNQFDLSITS